MKRISLEVDGSPVTVRVSKWTGRPKANGIYIRVPLEAENCLSIIKESIEVMFNIVIDTYVKDRGTHGLYIPEPEAVFLEEGTIILGLKEASKRGWLNSPVAT